MANRSSMTVRSLGNLLLLGAVVATPMAAYPQERAAPAGGGGGVRLIRSTSGSRGTQQGTRYIIEDPRILKMKLRPGQLLFSTRTLNLPALTPALYRVDLMMDGAPAWRGYLRVTE